MSVDLLAEQPSVAKEGISRRILAFAESHLFLLFSLFILLLAVAYINPFHETSISDDWAYILTSRHVYDTGQYQLHPWAAANLMTQAYWGALFALIGGFSIGTLHISTVASLLIGMVSLYLLAQEHGLNRKMSGLLVFCLAACPPVLFLSVTFMTDVPAVAFLIAAMLLYTRGLKQQSWKYMLAAGLVTMAAIFIRPTDLALVAGLGVIFLLDKARFSRWLLYAAGWLGPVVGGIILVAGGTASKLSTASPNGAAQARFMSHMDTFIPSVLLWKPAIFLIYMGYFAMPLVIASVAGVFVGGRAQLKLRPKVVAAVSVFVLAGLAYSVLVLHGSWKMPYLGYASDALDMLPLLGWLVTIIAVPGGIIVGTLAWERAGNWKRWTVLPLEQRFLDTVTAFMLVYYLVFFGTADRYLFVLIPFSFIVLGRHIQPQFNKLYRLVIVIGLLAIIITAMITRFFQAEQAAEWEASNYALTLGTTPLKVFGPWGWYASYNFYDFENQNPDKSDNGYMSEVWLPQRKTDAEYLTTNYKEDLTAEGWQVVKIFPYNDPLFQDRSVYLLKRPGS